jgi:hypothetical protein
MLKKMDPPLVYLKRMRGQEPLKKLKKNQSNLKIKWGQTPAFYFLRGPTHQVN